jgi:replicative DNA helicase
VDEFRRVCFVTLEMTPSELLIRMVQQETGCYRRPQDEFRRGLYDEAVTRFRGLPLTFIHPKAHGDTDIESICAAVRAEHDVDPFDCIYLDYFQLLTSVRGADMRHNEVQILSLAARELKQLAVECNCPVVVASQNHDQMNANKAVDLMVKGARSLEEVAALIIGIIKKDGAEVDVAVSKNRFGRSRVENLPIGWDVARCRFTEG